MKYIDVERVEGGKVLIVNIDKIDYIEHINGEYSMIKMTAGYVIKARLSLDQLEIILAKANEQ